MSCLFVKDSGDTCKAKAVKDSDYCFFHDPAHEEDRQLAVRNGGLNSSKNQLNLPQRVIRTPKDVVLVLEETLNHLRAGKIHPNYSNSIFIGCNTLLKAYEQSEVVRRIELIENTLNIQIINDDNHKIK